ncbi:MAG: hypothetical protein J6Z49_11420 [Kiritimatiellae bacterium]|nr:hypothetical protein [Kiritimatiellia bacterium]
MKNVIKNVLIAIAAFMPILLAAKPFGAMSEGEIEAADKERWGNRITLTGADWDDFEKLQRGIQTISDRMKESTDKCAVNHPDRLSILKSLLEELSRPLVTDSVALLPKAGDPDSTLRGKERVNAYKVMLQALERKSRGKLRILVGDLLGFQMVERRKRWLQVQDHFTKNKYTETFRKIDAAYEKFMHNMELMILRNVTDVTGSEMLMVSKLGDYATTDKCTMQAWLYNDTRLIDRYLFVMNEDALKLYAKYTAITKEESAAALAALAEDHDFYEAYALKIAPPDRKAFENFFKQCAIFLNHIDTVVKESEKMIATAKDSTSEVGMLRTNTGFSPYKAFLAAGPTQHNGCPGYARRVRVLLGDCKKLYMKHIEAMRRRYRDAPEKHIPTDWK